MTGRQGRSGRGPLAMAGLIGLAGAAYMTMIRRWILTWGATSDEAGRPLPGDSLMPAADQQTTRAVTVEAPAEAIWPWLVQIGSGGRAGMYSYDWLENLAGYDMHSADEIMPEHQGLAVGDVIPLGPKGPWLRAEIVDTGRVLAFRSTDRGIEWGWALILLAGDDGTTRLVSRNRFALPGASPPKRLAVTLFNEPTSLIMERKMLLGVKARAERPAHPVPSAV